MPLRRRGSLARRHPDRRAPTADGPGAFERQVQAALDGLPAQFGMLLRDVAVVVEDVPSPDQARGSDDEDGWLYGIYEGTPRTEWAADAVPVPNVITLFRVPLQEDFPDPADLAEEIRRTVIHELAHHAGIDDARLDELGYS